MSNATEREQEEKELKEMEQQLLQAAEAEKAKAAPVEPEPTPEPDASTAPVSEPVQDAPVTPQEVPAQDKPKDDPLEWAKRKGFKSPEDMARALLQKEQEFHRSRQQKEQQPPTPPQNWQARPDMGYGYPPPQYPYAPPPNPRQLAPYYPTLAPEDVERLTPFVLDAAEAIANRKVADLERRMGSQVGEIQRQAERNSEMMRLMQDPAFTDSRVQKELHKVLDEDPTIFQRERTPYTYAYEKALVNMARTQLQQGLTQESIPRNTPPVTAGGGTGFTPSRKITEREFESWSLEEEEAFIKSGGKTIPKR